MKIISKKEVFENINFYIDEIIKGKIFIYPTDTIYGIGCNAMISSSVNKIRELKKRDENKPFSVIAPNKEWIIQNCHVDENMFGSIKKLPGPYTFIFRLKNEYSISRKETIGDLDKIGVRIPDNWFIKLIQEAHLPFITTSVNISGEPSIKFISQIKEEIKKKVDYIIDNGMLNNKPSKIIDLSDGIEKILRE